MTAKARIEREPAYTYVAARLLLNKIYKEVLPKGSFKPGALDAAEVHRVHFRDYIAHGVEVGRLSADLLGFDMDRISSALRIERDEKFTYMGLQTIYDRYLLHDKERRIESPQYFWMRVSMGLGDERGRAEERAGDRVLRGALQLPLHLVHPHAVQLRHAAPAAQLVLPLHGDGRPGPHLQGRRRRREALQVGGRPGQRLDEHPRHRLRDQGNQRPQPGRDPVPEGGERHGRRRQPGRQAQGRDVRVPGDVAPGRRGLPGAAQEHGRRAPPHARHEHGELDPRPVHEAGQRPGPLDPLLPERRLRPPRPLRRGVREALPGVRGDGRPRRDRPLQARRGAEPLAQDAHDALSRRATPGSRSRTPRTSARRRTTSASSTARTSARRSC